MAVLEKRNFQVVEVWLFRRPEMNAGKLAAFSNVKYICSDGTAAGSASIFKRNGCCLDGSSMKGNLCHSRKGRRFRKPALHFQLHGQSMFFNMGSQFQIREIYGRHSLHPDRFPDAGGLHIPAGKAFVPPALFSTHLLHVKRIFRADGKDVFL